MKGDTGIVVLAFIILLASVLFTNEPDIVDSLNDLIRSNIDTVEKEGQK